MRTLLRALKAVSVITLIFFSWTYLQLYQIAAYAAVSKQESKNTKSAPKNQKPEERLEQLLDDLKERTGKAEEKAVKREDTTSDIEEIKSRKTEIEELDTDLKKEFSMTEKKIKDANLPKEILNRHNAFVKNYEVNLAELKANVDAIEKAKTPSVLTTELAKTKKHLDKVKPGKKHIPLNPNKLPHRIVKMKERAPRLKNEDFDKEFPRQRKQKSLGTAFNDWPNDISRDDRLQTARQPILLAFNDSFTDLPLSLGTSQYTPIKQEDTSLLILAQAAQYPLPPSSSDLVETPEIQFTPEIRAKAQELGFKPVKIYEWVRNNIDYQPYYGSFKGAQQTLLEGAGNDFDQASLLIALLRVSQIEAKYAYGTIELPVEKVMNWVGGVTDPRMAGSILASKGIPVKLIIVGGVAKYFQLEHVWVEAWIDYFPSRGAVHKTGHGVIWIPLDPSYKQFTYKQGMDMYSLMGFNAEDFLMSYITDTRDITAYQAYGNRLIDFIDANYPDATIDQVFGASEIKATKTIIKQEFPFLLGTLPYKVIAKAPDFSQVPSTKDYAITIQIEDIGSSGGSELSYSGNLTSLVGKRVTVSYEPATSADEALITQYGGNMLSVPPYLLSVKPVLKISGATVDTGAPIGLGQDQNIIINFAGPDGDTDRIQNIITAGDYSAIIIQSQDTPADTSSRNMATLIENSKKTYPSDVSLDDLLGQMLYSIGVMYFHNISIENGTYAKTLQLINSRQPVEAMVTHNVNVSYLFGMPRYVSEGSINIDVDRNINVVVSPIQDNDRIKAFMLLSGLSSSAWENRILEAFFDIPSISAVRLLKLATEQGVPVYTITGANLNDILPQLQVSYEVKTDVANAVNSGKKVIISKTNIIYDQWSGVGYVVADPSTGAAGYMISGGTAGGMTRRQPATSVRNVSQYFWGDGSALTTIVTRGIVLLLALSQLDTPYLWGGTNPDCGVDCSGFVHYLFTTIYGDEIFDRHRSSSEQHEYLVQKSWTHPYEEKLDADILWSNGYGHTGIFYGIPISGTLNTSDSVIHASGKPCPNPNDPNGRVPPPGCIQNDVNRTPVCGKFLRVIITSVNNAYFSMSGNPASDIGRPLP